MTQPDLKPLPCVPGDQYVLVPLHQFPEFTFPCATLLNMEWPRSRQSRLNGLWSCSRQFPVAMVLVECESREVFGFCKVSLIPKVPKACFIQSVVIHPEKRGQGLGSFLMRNVEEYLLSRRLRTIYLSTMGQEKFYSKLGYAECDPVSLYAFAVQSNFTKTSSEEESKICPSQAVACSNFKNNYGNTVHRKGKSVTTFSDIQSSKPSKTGKSAFHQPPPPPPPPPPLPKKPLGTDIMSIKTFMKKNIE